MILLASYLPMSPGVDAFLLPKLFLIFVGVALFSNPRRAWKQRRLRLPFIALIGAALLSGLVSESPWQAVLGRQMSPTYGVVGLLAAWLCYEAGEPGWERPLLWGAGGCAAVALLQYLPGFPMPPVSGRAFGTIGSPPMMGCMLALAFPVAGLALRPFLAAAIFASASRAGSLGALAGMLWTFPAWRLPGAAAVALGAATWAGSRPMGDSMRLHTWILAWRAFLERPLLGVGPDCFHDAFLRLRGPEWPAPPSAMQDNAHCLPLNILATQGLLGAVTWGRLLWAAPATASLVAVLVYGLFEPIPFMAWCVVAYQWGAMECAG